MKRILSCLGLATKKDIRKACELPVKKELVHYASRYGEKKNVTKYRPAIYGTFDVVLEDGTQHRIHRDYFRSMQKPSFLKDMQDEDKNI